MSYIDSILGPDEQILFRTSSHWVTYLNPLVAVAAVAFLWPYLSVLVTSHLPGAVLAGIASVWLGITYLRQSIEEHVVTTERVISRWGILRRDVFVYPLDSIDTIDVHQGLVGRVLGYGTVELHTSAETHSTGGRAYIRDPDQWREHILEARDKRRNGAHQVLQSEDGDSAVERMRQLDALAREGLITNAEHQQKRDEILRDL
ncbi:MAG: PH domain-containing protein [Acidobacteria bacterium]|nr:PH domain-containing protein [Acidobacteriota bacterium]